MSKKPENWEHFECIWHFPKVSPIFTKSGPLWVKFQGHSEFATQEHFQYTSMAHFQFYWLGTLQLHYWRNHKELFEWATWEHHSYILWENFKHSQGFPNEEIQVTWSGTLNVLTISCTGKIAGNLAWKILNELGVCWVRIGLVLCPFPCDVFAMYWPRTLPLAPSDCALPKDNLQVPPEFLDIPNPWNVWDLPHPSIHEVQDSEDDHDNNTCSDLRLWYSSSTLWCYASRYPQWSLICWYKSPTIQQSQTMSSILKTHCQSPYDNCSSCSKDWCLPKSSPHCSPMSSSLYGLRPTLPSSRVLPSQYGSRWTPASSLPYMSWSQLLNGHSTGETLSLLNHKG